MAAFTWDGHDDADWNFSIIATNLIKFCGAAFATKVIVGSFQEEMHIRTAAGTDTDACASPHLHNIMYVDANNCDIDGAGSEDVANILTTECIRVQFTHGSAVNTENAIFYAYDGTTTTTPPVGVTFHALEQGDAAWTNAEGSASAVSISNQGSSDTHNFYVAISATPESVGEKTSFSVRMELDYY